MSIKIPEEADVSPAQIERMGELLSSDSLSGADTLRELGYTVEEEPTLRVVTIRARQIDEVLNELQSAHDKHAERIAAWTNPVEG